MSPSSSRRRGLRVGVVAAATAFAAAVASPALAGTGGDPAPAATTATYDLTVMGTTDLHGNVFNWDYFRNADYYDGKAATSSKPAVPSNAVGLARISTLVDQVREAKGRDHTLLIDAGDTIQGTPLAYYYAKVDPITGKDGRPGPVHPMAAAMNAIGYDAAALGNHEFNYGIPLLRKFQSQLTFPLLGANALVHGTRTPAFDPYVIKTMRGPGGQPIRVGILGLTNPGIAIWDKANVAGQMDFDGLVEEARTYVPKMRAAGADVVIVSAHSGADTSSSYGDALPYPENAATLVAQKVPGIDAILVGHAHQEIAQRFVMGPDHHQVLLTEPLKWGMRLAVIDLQLKRIGAHWTVAGESSQLLNSNTAQADPKIVNLLTDDHQKVVDYVNSVIGKSLAPMSAATARYEDTSALDFINQVQGEAVRNALAGTADANLPVLSIAAPFNKDAAIPEGDVSVRDVAGLYIYDNTLLGIKLTGEQVKAYLEKSAEYFKPATRGAGPYTPDELTNATTPNAPSGTPDYNYDVMGGIDHKALTYDIDLSAPVGSRIKHLAYDGQPIDASNPAMWSQQFVVAINNYRQSGGGGFPGVTTAPVVYNAQAEIRQLLIDWVTAKGTIDPSTFSSTDWRLTSGETAIQIND